jgi:hypothetical protein
VALANSARKKSRSAKIPKPHSIDSAGENLGVFAVTEIAR